MLEGKVAYITGGTKGIGFGIAKSLSEAGMQVALSGRKLGDAKTAAGKLRNAFGIASNVKNFEDEIQALKQVHEHFGKVDVVIANAGLGHFASVEDLTTEQWNEMIDTNLTGVFHTLKAAIPALKESKGYFISIASLAGTNFFAGGAGYNATKFGVVGFTQAAMLDLRKYHIKTTVIMPGSVKSYFNDHQPDDSEDAWKIYPEDIGQLIVDLLKMNPRALPSKVEIRPTVPPSKK